MLGKEIVEKFESILILKTGTQENATKKPASEKITPTRCKSCSACTDNCEKMAKPINSWCKVCTNKKKDGNKARKGCENRGTCIKFLSSEEGKLWTHTNENPHNKRKTEESPVLKQARKLVKGDPEAIKEGCGVILDLTDPLEDSKF